MKVTFLEAKVPLTKTFRLVDGEIDKDGHPKIVPYLSHHYEVSHTDLQQFFELVQHHAALGHCWQKGNATEKLEWTRRADRTDPNEPTRILVLDLDGVKGLDDIPTLLRYLKLGSPDYIVQYSSSMGVLPGKGLSAHIFVLLDREYLPSELKDWLRHRNFAIPELAAGIKLSKNGNALRWTLDVTTCQSDKLIYIAPPICEAGVVDGFKGERIRLVRQETRTARLDQEGYTPESNSQRTQAKMDELRKLAGLKARPWDKTREERGENYMPNPDKATVSGTKDRGEYVSVNLNGGDSWGYWHRKENPYFLYNFKGEPVFRIKDISPDYWASLQRAHRREVDSGGIEYLAFRDIKRSKYYNGTYDRATDQLELYEADSEGQLFSYLKEHGQSLPDVIPTWKVEYDPHDPVRVDPKRKWLNLYQPSEFERRWGKERRQVAEVPALARKFIWHAVGCSEECYERFLNWLACIVQHKDRTQTAWLLHGVQGTGKGYIFNELMRPALGMNNTMTTNLENFEGQFNAFLENKLLICVDESDMQASALASVLEGKFRQYITEPKTPIRAMRKTTYEVASYLNFLIFANETAGVNIVDHDRRYNVAPYQDFRIDTTDEEYQQAKNDAWDFYCYLRTRAADVQLAKTAIMNDAKRQVAAQSKSSVEEFTKAWRNGNLDFFVAYIPSELEGFSRPQQDLALSYRKVVEAMGAWAAVSRDELHILGRWLIDKCPQSPNKFTKMLQMHRIEIHEISRDGKKFRGTETHWLRK